MTDTHGPARTREQPSGAFYEGEDVVDENKGPLNAARHHPLAALGIAFAIGFALGTRGDDDHDNRHPAVSRARNQIKGAIIGGVSAAISHQLRSFIEDQGGIGALLAAVGVDIPGGDQYVEEDAYDIG